MDDALKGKIVGLLDTYAETVDQINNIARPIDEQIAKLQAERNKLVEKLEAERIELEVQCRALVLGCKESVKGSKFFAVYNKGRSGGFDTKALEALAKMKEYQFLNEYRKPDGEPYVIFREVC